MARKNDTPTETELSEAAIAARTEIANRPRQSVVKFVQHYVTIRDTAPEELERLFGDQVSALEEVADKVPNVIQLAIEKVTTDQLERSIKALENEDPLNGYAAYVFDAEVFAEKTREKVARGPKKTVAEKANDLLAEASDEDLAALRELLAARGL